MKSLWIKLGFILFILLVGLWIVIPQGFKLTGIKKEAKLAKGLDLIGGVHLAYQADLKDIADKDKDSALTSLKNTIDKRINSLGVSEPLIQSRKYGANYGIIVELPGIKDINSAINLIGKTALLQFKEQDSKGKWQKTSLTGKDLKRADATINQESGEPVVSIEFNSEGAKKFADLTKKNLNKPLAIYLDNQLVSAPNVQAQINDGKAIIEGQFNINDAKKLAIQLNAGALPVPIKIIEQRNVGATLGADSIQKSLFAGLIGLILVAIFMILNYRLPGLIAVIALIIYSIINLAIFKISTLTPWGITLTLAGVAGFILSIGMAVDANILIFERAKEEFRKGEDLLESYINGFRRAWLSIRDSNISSIITALILFWFGSGSVRGFALILIIGILTSLFTAITVSKTLLLLTASTKLKNIKWLYGIKK
ncbi:MAG: protein translocase subunit SecD [Candidatus Margulisiibacteriota bacterium]|jgi:preprotein translocase subunit SecD